ncbi:uroporphyrinogen-III synthase [Croceibacterium sp. TMG7-5b_MA50]|uniref:uroporphyrinogen-III synthase n=1 Tax=Croceibacterium sp. TMG7-5b_MA50 TaxID=3121290 RepID=UPI003221B4C2
MIPVVVLRPEPGNAATMRAGRLLGLPMVAAPVFRVDPLAWVAPPECEFDALLLGSANAVRHAGPQLSAYRGKPALCVGATTAEAAEAAGLAVIACGSGGLQDLLDSRADWPARLLRLGGESHVSLVPPAGVTIDLRAVYRVVAEPLDHAPVRGPCVLLLHSADAAAHVADEFVRLSLPRGQVRVAALGARIAAAAGQGWGMLAPAERPNDAALLALAAQLCQDPA